MSANFGATDNTVEQYLNFYPYQQWLVVVNSIISSVVFLLVAYVAIMYVRKLQEKGMMLYLITLSLLSQAMYLCISWTKLVSYWAIEQRSSSI